MTRTTNRSWRAVAIQNASDWSSGKIMTGRAFTLSFFYNDNVQHFLSTFAIS